MFLKTIFCAGTVIFAAQLTATSARAQEIPYQKNVSLEVGQSAVIYGVRGKCGQAAPSWEEIAAQLPNITTGKFSDGGVGTRYSRGCGGTTPARAIQLTATSPGREQLMLFQDPVNIEVK